VKIGILSDSHDRHPAFIAAVNALRAAGAEYYIHCGDVGSPDILDHLAGLPAAFVWGNTDVERAELQRYAGSIGVTCLGNHGILDLGGKRVGVLHGDDFRLRQQLLDGQQLDYLLQGHTHERADERFGRTRLINPGALHRAAQKSVATLDIVTDELRYITLAL
jgi:putative phosphoesterase